MVQSTAPFRNFLAFWIWIVLYIHLANRVWALGAASVAPRLDIMEMFAPDNMKMSNLFLQAMHAMMELPPEDHRSYYQIAGIHGLPFVAYRDSVNKSYSLDPSKLHGWAGYCQHGSVLFPTWHRAYMILIEKTMIDLSKDIASRFENKTVREEYQRVAEQIRFPYWDWSSELTPEIGVPDMLLKENVDVFIPPNGEVKSILNPLQGFTSPIDVGEPMRCQGCNPYDKPYEVLSLETGFYPYLPKGFRTVRQPNRENAQTQVQQLQQSVKFFSQANWQTATHAALRAKSWLKFSNHGTDKDGEVSEERSFYYNSLEAVHNAVHLGVGGWGGQMAYSESAAFDPIFFLQHANVDRLFAEWQASNPNAWIEPAKNPQSTFTSPAGMTVDSKTPLTPFRKGDGSSANEYYNSDDVRSTHALGYSYKSVENLMMLPAEKRRKMMLEHFTPGDSLKYRWFVSLPHTKVKNAPEPFKIDVFIGATFSISESNNETEIMRHYAGTFNVWHQSPININNGLNSQSVDITHSMVSQDISTTPIPRTVQENDFTDIDNLFDRARFSLWTKDDLQFHVHSLDGRDFSSFVDIGEPLIFFTSEDDDDSTIDNYVEVYPNLKVHDIDDLKVDAIGTPKSNRRLLESNNSNSSYYENLLLILIVSYFRLHL